MNKTAPALLFLYLSVLLTCADATQVLSWGDQGDGTYKNPIINSDYSDPDAIRVGSDYYLITSTFHLSPGITVLHSKDLVNWEIIGHALSDIAELGPDYSPDRMRGYGRGIWAPAIRFHDGKFWVYVFDPGYGLYMTTAITPAGPWEPMHKVFEAKNFDDCCPFWDDDGQMYLSCANFQRIRTKDFDKYKAYDLIIYKLTPDGKSLQDKGTVVHTGWLCEATKMYKINGWYYVFYCEHFPDKERVQMAMRAKNVYGPYEQKRLCQSRVKDPGDNAAQGGLVQTETGDWYYLHHLAMFPNFVGRTLALQPVTWINDWPIIGDVQPDGVGCRVMEGKKPIAGFPITRPQTEVDFNSPKLGLQWEWNNSPRNDKWSLTEKKGSLRLYASMPLKDANPSKPPEKPTDTPERRTFDRACNTLLQRIMGEKFGEATACMDVSRMADGQLAGLCVVTANHGMLEIVQTNSQRYLRAYTNSKLQDGKLIAADKIWLKFINNKSVFQFYYSANGTDFEKIGEKFTVSSWYRWRGVEFGLFCWNELKAEGFIDVNAFKYNYE